MAQVPLPSSTIHSPHNRHYELGLAGATLSSHGKSHGEEEGTVGENVDGAEERRRNRRRERPLFAAMDALPLRIPLIPAPLVALFVFCWFTINNGFSWLMFAPVTHKVVSEYRPNVSLSQVELLNSWQPLIYCVVLVPMLKLLSRRNGLRTALILGAQFEVLGAILKLFSTVISHELAAVVFLHVGQMCSAISSPVAIGAPALLSSLFFSPRWRTTCTGIAVVSNNIGNALGYTINPMITLAVGFQGVVWLEVLSGALLCLCAMLFMPRQEDGYKEGQSTRRRAALETPASSPDSLASPPTPTPQPHYDTAAVLGNSASTFFSDQSPSPSRTALPPLSSDRLPRQRSGPHPPPAVTDRNAASHQKERNPLMASSVATVATASGGGSHSPSHTLLRRDMRAMLTSPNVALLMLMYAWCSGGYVAWTSLFDAMLEGQFDIIFVGTLSFVGTVGYIVGGIVTAAVTDAFFRRQMRGVILFCCVMNSIGCAIFAASIWNSADTVFDGMPSVVIVDADDGGHVVSGEGGEAAGLPPLGMATPQVATAPTTHADIPTVPIAMATVPTTPPRSSSEEGLPSASAGQLSPPPDILPMASVAAPSPITATGNAEERGTAESQMTAVAVVVESAALRSRGFRGAAAVSSSSSPSSPSGQHVYPMTAPHLLPPSSRVPHLIGGRLTQGPAHAVTLAPGDTLPPSYWERRRRGVASEQKETQGDGGGSDPSPNVNATSSPSPFLNMTRVRSAGQMAAARVRNFFTAYMAFWESFDITLTHSMLLFLVAFCGFFNGSSAPIFFELVAEIAYPINEAISGNAMSMAENIGSLLLYQVVARWFSHREVNYVFALGMLLTILVGLCVRVQYKRSEAHEARRRQRGRGMHEEGGDDHGEELETVVRTESNPAAVSERSGLLSGGTAGYGAV